MLARICNAVASPLPLTLLPGYLGASLPTNLFLLYPPLYNLILGRQLGQPVVPCKNPASRGGLQLQVYLNTPAVQPACSL